MEIPATVTNPDAQLVYRDTNQRRSDVKSAAELVKTQIGYMKANALDGEAIANATLAYRHLEDASMRLGKVLQALDGGVSVYDRATTVGA